MRVIGRLRSRFLQQLGRFGGNAERAYDKAVRDLARELRISEQEVRIEANRAQRAKEKGK